MILEQMRRRPVAFSIIELLVVIGIIAILTGLLIPTITRARRAAMSVTCSSTLRQLDTAFVQYSALNKGQSFERGVSAAANTGLSDPSLFWMGVLTPFFGNNGVIPPCPETPIKDPGQYATAVTQWWQAQPSLLGNYAGSYAFNGWLYNPVNYGISPAGIQLATYGTKDTYFAVASIVEHSSDVPVFVDCAWCEIWPKPSDTIVNLQDPFKIFRTNGVQPPGLAKASLNRHPMLTVNVAFADGSVRNIHPQNLWKLRWSTQFTPTTLSIGAVAAN